MHQCLQIGLQVWSRITDILKLKIWLKINHIRTKALKRDVKKKKINAPGGKFLHKEWCIKINMQSRGKIIILYYFYFESASSVGGKEETSLARNSSDTRQLTDRSFEVRNSKRRLRLFSWQRRLCRIKRKYCCEKQLITIFFFFDFPQKPSIQKIQYQP